MQPNATMLEHTNGILYGTAYQGGTGNYGTVFSLKERLPAYGGKAAKVSSESATYLTAVVPTGAVSGQRITVKTGDHNPDHEPALHRSALKSFAIEQVLRWNSN